MLIEQLAGWMDAAPGTARKEAAVSLVKILEESIADPEELEAAEAALTCLLDDPDIKIRQTLAEELSRLETPPRYLILALAGDEPEISIPVLARSGVLLDGELITHVRNGTEKQQIAIACSAELSSRLCAVIADEASPNTAGALENRVQRALQVLIGIEYFLGDVVLACFCR